MKKILTLISFAILCLAGCQGFQHRYDKATLTPGKLTGISTPGPNLITSQPLVVDSDIVSFLGYEWNGWQVYQPAVTADQFQALPDFAQQPQYHLEINISRDFSSISGHAAVRYTNTTGVPLNQIVFRIYPDLLGSSATISNVSIKRGTS